MTRSDCAGILPGGSVGTATPLSGDTGVSDWRLPIDAASSLIRRRRGFECRFAEDASYTATGLPFAIEAILRLCTITGASM